jgi:hypothetical protein
MHGYVNVKFLEYLMKMQVFWDMALCSLAVQEDNVLDLEDGDRKLLCAVAIYH